MLGEDERREAELEGNKLRADAYKTQATIATAALLAAGAVGTLRPVSNNLVFLVIAFSCILFSLILVLGALHLIATDVQLAKATSPSRHRIYYMFSIISLGLGFTNLILFVASSG